MGPVRRGNAAYEQMQHDVYGSVVLGSTHLFYDQRLVTPGDDDRVRAAGVSRRAGVPRSTTSPTPGSGSSAAAWAIHTYSSVMSLGGLRPAGPHRATARARRPRHAVARRADEMRERILERAYDAERGRLHRDLGRHRLDASLLLLVELGFVPPTDPRFLATLDAVEKHLQAR